jgi:hypothetical protein
MLTGLARRAAAGQEQEQAESQHGITDDHPAGAVQHPVQDEGTDEG